MKKVLLFAIALCVVAAVRAQKVYFIYIQSEAGSPFYLKMGDKVLSSSTSGYLIVPQLKDSTYSFMLGQAAEQGGELRFSIAVNGADHGYLLKKFPNGWGLFDLQSAAVIMPSESAASFKLSKTLQEDRFTNLLAKAVNDSTLLMQPVFAKNTSAPNQKESPKRETANVEKPVAPAADSAVLESVRPEPVAAEPVKETREEKSVAVKPDSAAAKIITPPAQERQVDMEPEAEEKTDSVSGSASPPAFKRSTITRRSESSTTEGFGLVFWDETDGVVDTIRIVIPNPVLVFQEEKPVPSGSVKFLDINSDSTQQAAGTAQTQKAAATTPCRQTAAQSDFLALRKFMAARDTEAEMIEEAKKYFQEKCFTTEQVGNLSKLFLTQQGKIRFLEKAYPHVSDREQFATLQSELSEESYIKRFQALLVN